MTLVEFIGCAFLAFGPPLAMFSFTIAKDPIRIIILIASAFFWLLSLLLSSLVWFAVIHLRGTLEFGVIFSVLFQELFRFLLCKLLKKAEGGLKKVSNGSAQINDNKHVLAYVSGLGFGIMSGAFSLVNVLADAVGPGTMGLKGGSEFFFITSASISLCFILLHTFWGVIFFSAVEKKNWMLVIWVLGSHMMVSCMTLLTRRMYLAALLPVYIILIITGSIAFYVAGGTVKNMLVCMKCKRNTVLTSD